MLKFTVTTSYNKREKIRNQISVSILKYKQVSDWEMKQLWKEFWLGDEKALERVLTER